MRQPTASCCGMLWHVMRVATAYRYYHIYQQELNNPKSDKKTCYVRKKLYLCIMKMKQLKEDNKFVYYCISIIFGVAALVALWLPLSIIIALISTIFH